MICLSQISNLFVTTRFVRLNFSKDRIGFFLKNCETDKHEIFPKYSLFYILYKNVLDNERIRKNIAL